MYVVAQIKDDGSLGKPAWRFSSRAEAERYASDWATAFYYGLVVVDTVNHLVDWGDYTEYNPELSKLAQRLGKSKPWKTMEDMDRWVRRHS